MNAAQAAELLTLAAIWGASFLFMRMGAAEFGPVALSGVRVGGAALLLMPLLAWQGRLAALRRHWRPVFVVGLTNSALPFLLFSYAALSITAGLASIFNAATPLFVGLIGWLWLKDRLSPLRSLGLAIGFVGVLALGWHNASGGSSSVGVAFGAGGAAWPVLACIAGSLSYGYAANFTKRTLTGVPPLVVAAGSQLGAAAALLPLAWIEWPARSPLPTAWLAAATLALMCTGVAYILYFRLIAQIGPSKAITVTFLVPVFAVAWGGMFLGERVDAAMALGCGVIVFGTALATGVLRRPQVRLG